MRKGTEHFLVPVKSVAELPPPVGALVRAAQPETGIRQIVLIPPQEYPTFSIGWLRDLPFRWHKTPRRTLVFGDDQITLIEESAPESFSTILIPYTSICDIHLCTVLLRAYTEINWVREGQIERLKLEFNLVGLRYIRRGLEHVRSRMLSAPLPSMSSGEPPLKELPLKFRNFMRSSLLPGETVLTAVFQPAIRLPFHALVASNCATVITCHHLIFVDEEASASCREYAANVRFYPLSRIRQVEIEAGQEYSLLRLTVGVGSAVHEVAVPMSHPNATVLQRHLSESQFLYENQYNQNFAH